MRTTQLSLQVTKLERYIFMDGMDVANFHKSAWSFGLPRLVGKDLIVLLLESLINGMLRRCFYRNSFINF